MHHTTFFPIYLGAFNAHLGLWEYTRLVSRVSPLSVEAMNLILEKGGILAYIGTREELSRYLENSSRRTEKASPRFWISPELDTILGILGLYPQQDEVGRSELIFYGSPLTWTLAVMIACSTQSEWLRILDENPNSYFLSLEGSIAGPADDLMVIHERMTIGSSQLDNPSRLYITKCDVQLARSYLMPQQMAKHVPGADLHWALNQE